MSPFRRLHFIERWILNRPTEADLALARAALARPDTAAEVARLNA